MSKNFLLVGSNPNSAWAGILREGLQPYGDLTIVEAPELSELPAITEYDLIVIDAGAIEDLASLLAEVRREKPSIPIVVVTTSPTWQRARQVFMLGATDYIRKTMDPDALSTTFEEILSKKAPA
jgi:DNA-binding NarL/FixJ family response regulator